MRFVFEKNKKLIKIKGKLKKINSSKLVCGVCVCVSRLNEKTCFEFKGFYNKNEVRNSSMC